MRKDGIDISIEEGKEIIIWPGDVLKFTQEKFHYKIHFKPERDDTESGEESNPKQQKNKSDMRYSFPALFQKSFKCLILKCGSYAKYIIELDFIWLNKKYVSYE